MALQPKEADGHEDLSRDKTFLRYFKALPEKPKTTVRLFDRNEIYTVHGEDAVFVSQDFFQTSAVLKTYGAGADKLESVWLNKIKFEGLLRHLLLVRQYRVEVYKTKSAYRIASNDWSIVSKASPGNLSDFEDILFGQNGQAAPAGVVAVKLANEGGQKIVGLGYADITSLSLKVAEFVDNDQYSNFEAALVQLDPEEVIVSTGDLQSEGCIHQILGRSRCLVTEFKKSHFTNKDNVQDLGRLLKQKTDSQKSIASSAEWSKVHGMSSLSALIKYLELMSKQDLFNQFTLATFDLSQYMRLDSAAVAALHLMPSTSEGGNKNQSVYGLLNHCRTPQGQRLLCHWIKQPLLDVNKIDERLNLIEIFVTNAALRQSLHDDHLVRLPDYQRLAKRFYRSRGSLQDCYRVYESLDKLPRLTDSLLTYSGPHETLLKAAFITPFNELIADFVKFQEMVESTLDLAKISSHEFVVRADFDEDLAQMRKTMDGIEAGIKTQFNIIVRDLGTDTKTVKLESNSQLGFFLRITRKDEKLLRNNKNYRTIDTNKNGVRFRNSRMSQLNTDFQRLKDDYNKQQASVVTEILSIATGYTEPMVMLNDIIAQLDVIVGFSHASVCAPTPYVRPTLHPQGSGILRLKEARHPCVEMQDDIAFIPNDVNLEKDKQIFHIITGPNMGGKSTYIRSVGVVVLLAQLGCFVPCDSAEVTIVDSILVRVGAGDNQQKGVSTFMAEMLDTATILNTATEASLVIVDELGRGTSTYDGFGLAWAISEHIATKIKSFTLFATHFHEMTQLADTVATVNNLHVSALTSADTLTLLYKVKQGVCDQSFGIHVAELAHFPSHVIKMAREKASTLEDFQLTTLTDHPHLAGDSEAAVLKRKLHKTEGESIIRDFLSKVKAMDMTQLSDSEIKTNMDELKRSVLGHENVYVRDVLARGV